MSRLPRWVHRLYARVFGFFWLPCPTCGQMFGGHEAGDRHGLPGHTIVNGRHVGICPNCTYAGRGYTPTL